LPVDRHGSLVGPGQSGHDVQKGAFARSAGAHDGDEFAAGDRKRHVAEGVDDRIALPESFGDALDAHGRFRTVW